MSVFNSIRNFGSSMLVRAAAAAAAKPAKPALQTIILPAARDRWMTVAASTFTPAMIESTLRGALSGNLVAQWQLFDLMESTWPRLLKDLSELKRAASMVEWNVQAWADKNQDPSPEAQRRANLLDEAIWNMHPRSVANENGFTGTVKELLDGWAKGIAVIEIDWELRESPGRISHQGRKERKVNGTLIAPRATRWVHPRYYGYAYDGDELKLNALEIAAIPGKPPAGAREADWIEFPEDKFLIGICSHKSGHPITGALLRPLAWWWCASNFSASWLLNFAQIFGLPIRWATYDPNMPGVLEKVSEMLENMGSAAWGAFPAGTTIELKESAKSGSDNPQSSLLDRADRQCDILILGQTLTTDAPNTGTQALGTVHEGVRADVIDAVAGWAADILNQQFIAPFCRLNFGDTDEMPWFQPARKEAKDAKAMADRDKVLLDAGVEMPKAWFYERHEIPMPEAGDDVIGKPPPVAVGPGGGGQRTEDRGQKTEDGGQKTEDRGKPVQAVQGLKGSEVQWFKGSEVQRVDGSGDWRQQALAQAMGVVPEWLAPLDGLFKGLETVLQDKSKSDADILVWIENAARAFPDKFADMDLEFLARRFETALGAATIQGLKEAGQ